VVEGNISKGDKHLSAPEDSRLGGSVQEECNLIFDFSILKLNHRRTTSFVTSPLWSRLIRSYL
jgi:hypothetical protein